MNYSKILFSLLTSSLILSSESFAQKKYDNSLDPIVITASPLKRSESQLVSPITVISGDDLLNKTQPTIGETLANEPGIRSSYFGPNASRPIIRGLGGDQITILQNGINNLDVSAESDDHNVAIDPLSVERIEVIRGPAALLYGSKAVGGVVNIIDNRIPDKQTEKTLTGKTDVRYNTANKERAGSILLEGDVGSYTWHINGLKRITDNVKIPGFARSQNLRQSDPLPVEEESRDRLTNSQSNTQGTTVGLSKFFKKGYFGASFTNYETNYGVVAEEDVTIDLQQQRIDFAGLFEDPFKNIKEIKYKLAISDYEHTEFEGSEAGTVFDNEGHDARVEIVHDKIGFLEGAIGFQTGQSDFEAIGDEAFLPPTVTDNNALFIFEEIPLDNLTLQAGGRIEHQRIEREQSVNFGAGDSRDDFATSGSLGLVYDLSKKYSAKISTSYTERAPNAQETFANGEHVATNTFEVGDRNLKVQKSYGVDLSLRKKAGFFTGEINLFYNRFQDFIALVPTGQNDPNSGLPIFNYVNLQAEFFGGEFKTLFSALDTNSTKLDFEIRGDYVEARDSNTGETLPRISPPRVGGSVIYNHNNIGLRVDGDYTFDVNNVTAFETQTDGYFMLNAGADYNLKIGSLNSILYVKGTNLLDDEARLHTSFLKDIAPLSGRSLLVGIRTEF